METRIRHQCKWRIATGHGGNGCSHDRTPNSVKSPDQQLKTTRPLTEIRLTLKSPGSGGQRHARVCRPPLRTESGLTRICAKENSLEHPRRCAWLAGVVWTVGTGLAESGRSWLAHRAQSMAPPPCSVQPDASAIPGPSRSSTATRPATGHSHRSFTPPASATTTSSEFRSHCPGRSPRLVPRSSAVPRTTTSARIWTTERRSRLPTNKNVEMARVQGVYPTAGGADQRRASRGHLRMAAKLVICGEMYLVPLIYVVFRRPQIGGVPDGPEPHAG